jgi:hypothetical protein
MCVRNISFGVVVSGITETECNALIDQLIDEDMVEEGHSFGSQRWELDELKYDQQGFNIFYIEPDSDEEGLHYFHADRKRPDEGGRLMITFDWYHGGTRKKDRVSYKNNFDKFIEIQQKLLNLQNDIQSITEHKVTVGTIESQ